MQVVNKHEKLLSIISHQETNIKATMRFHPIPVRMAIRKQIASKDQDKGTLISHW
jgi:hypothetical protein